MSLTAAFMVPHPPMIVPEIGRGGEKQIEETIRAYEQAADEIAALAPDTIIITSPHSVMYADYFHISPGRSAKGSFADFRAPQVRFEETYDEELADQIAAFAAERGFPAGLMGEREKKLDHGTMVPLYFIRKRIKSGKIVRIGLSGLPLTMHYELGMMIRDAVLKLNRRAVFVASGDLSHKLQTYGPYGFAPEGPAYDERIMDVCGRGAFGELFDFDEAHLEKAAECGHRSFVIMAGALDGMAVEVKKLSHQDVTGVGYGICSFLPGEASEERRFLKRWREEQAEALKKRRGNEDSYVRLARETIENYVLRRERIPVPDWTPQEMKDRKAGAFVSIHKDGRLRGCIGTILPVYGSLAEEIIHNAVSASTRDPRFDAVRPEELDRLEINVDVLSEPEAISGKEELDVRRYGVIVSSGGKRGLLLPDLDGVDTVDEQIEIAMKKGGISPRDRITLERFEVVRHV